jgi:hypothetical protein
VANRPQVFFWMGVWLVGMFLGRVLCKVVGTPSQIDEIELTFRYMKEHGDAAPLWVLERRMKIGAGGGEEQHAVQYFE